MVKLKEFYNSKRVLLTGHTGFKGSWMSAFLHELGANVQGYSLNPKDSNELFNKASISDYVNDLRGDILDINKLKNIISTFRPEIVFHFAAQPLVIESYRIPRYTWEVNVMGTFNLLECLMDSDSVKSIVVITTDKVYKNEDKANEHKENDRLVGFDPYSSSKAAVEILVDSMYNSFFKIKMIGLATARSGNVIGGGDWSEDRLIPDYYRAFHNKTSFELRNPSAIRPWQHVIDVLNGYSILGMKLYNNSLAYSQPWNFGPSKSFITTNELISKLNMSIKLNLVQTHQSKTKIHETNTLRLDSSKSNELLGWFNILDIENSLDLINSIYINYYNSDIQLLIKNQIENFIKLIELQK